MVDTSLSNVIVTGGQGTVGSAIPFGTKLSRKQLDITNSQQVEQVLTRLRPKVVVHPAALTNVDYCQTHPSEAYRTNTWGTYHLAQWTKKAKALLVLISTGAVFAGKRAYKVTDTPNPINIYGRTKLAAELMASDINHNTIIVRTGWIFGHQNQENKFVGKLTKKISEGATILQAATNNIGCPTYADDLGRALSELIKQPKPGTYHIVNQGRASRYQVAQEIVKHLKVKVDLQRAKLEDFQLQAPRPLIEVLVPTKPRLRSWQKALSTYLATQVK